MNTALDFDEDGGAAPANMNAAPGDDPAAIMDTFRAPDIEGEAEAAPDDVRPVDEAGQIIQDAAEQITKGAFWLVWQNGFGLPGLFSPVWKPLGIQPDEEHAARAASDAVYELLEIYWPSALMPQSDTFARIATAAPFLIAKVMIVRGILADRKAQRIEAQRSQAVAFRSGRASAPAANVDAAPGSPVSWMDAEEKAA